LSFFDESNINNKVTDPFHKKIIKKTEELKQEEDMLHQDTKKEIILLKEAKLKVPKKELDLLRKYKQQQTSIKKILEKIEDTIEKADKELEQQKEKPSTSKKNLIGSGIQQSIKKILERLSKQELTKADITTKE